MISSHSPKEINRYYILLSIPLHMFSVHREVRKTCMCVCVDISFFFYTNGIISHPAHCLFLLAMYQWPFHTSTFFVLAPLYESPILSHLSILESWVPARMLPQTCLRLAPIVSSRGIVRTSNTQQVPGPGLCEEDSQSLCRSRTR